jgi:hypothetical protein
VRTLPFEELSMNRARLSSFVIASAFATTLACSSSSTDNGNDAGGDGGIPANDSGARADTGTGTDSGTDAGNDGDNGDATPPDDGPIDNGTEYDATLTGAEVLPATITTATGTAKFFLQADNVTLKYDVTTSAQNVTVVALHVGAPGESGAVIHPLTPLSGHMTGNITLTADEADKIAQGLLYVDVLTQAKPSGELRGQIVLPGSTIFVASASGAQEVPAVTTSCHAHASFILNAGKDTARYHFATDCTPTDVNVKKAIASLTGPVVFPLAPVGTTIDGTLTLTATDADDLAGGQWYVNVVTAANATGEVRGQVIMPGESLYASALSGATERPPVSTTATGGAQVILSADKKSARYEVVVTGIIPTAAELDNGSPGANGATLYSLTLGGTGAKGMTAVTANDVSLLATSKVYVNVKTASNPSGELRGDLVAY